jgi:hypothetical protein
VTKAPPIKIAKPVAHPPLKPIRAASTAGVVLSPPTPIKPPPPPKDSKQYGGEFYPVVKTTHGPENAER